MIFFCRQFIVKIFTFLDKTLVDFAYTQQLTVDDDNVSDLMVSLQFGPKTSSISNYRPRRQFCLTFGGSGVFP